MSDLVRISSGSRFEELAAYSRAVIDDRYIHISGTVGSDPDNGSMPDDVADQVANIFRTVEQVLTQNGADFQDVTRTRVYLTDIDHLMPVAEALRTRFSACPPANTTLLCGIPAPGAKVEIEFTARLKGQF